MFSHVMIGTNDLDKAKAFYDAVLGTLGVGPRAVPRHRVFWRTPTGVFSVSLPIDAMHRRAATAAPDPLLDPPGTPVGSHGFTHGPK